MQEPPLSITEYGATLEHQLATDPSLYQGTHLCHVRQNEAGYDPLITCPPLANGQQPRSIGGGVVRLAEGNQV